MAWTFCTLVCRHFQQSRQIPRSFMSFQAIACTGVESCILWRGQLKLACRRCSVRSSCRQPEQCCASLHKRWKRNPNSCRSCRPGPSGSRRFHQTKKRRWLCPPRSFGMANPESWCKQMTRSLCANWHSVEWETRAPTWWGVRCAWFCSLKEFNYKKSQWAG